MIQLKTLRLRNFRSHVDTRIDFDELPNETLILGNVWESPGVDSNQAGKSSIFYGISWALFGRWLSRVSKEDVIRFGSTEVIVELELQNGKNNYIITRKRTRGKTNKLIIHTWIDDKKGEDISGHTVTQSQNVILKILNISPGVDYVSDFHSAVFFSNDSIRNFAGPGLTNEERVSTLARFLKVDQLDVAKKYTSEARLEKTRSENELLAKIELITEEIENKLVSKEELDTLTNQDQMIQKELKEVEEIQAKADKARELFLRYKTAKETLTNQEESLQRLIVNTEAEIERLREALIELQRSKKMLEDTEEPDTDYFQTVINDMNQASIELNNMITSTRHTLEDINFTMKKLEEQLTSIKKCPACEVELMVISENITRANREVLKEELAQQEEIKGLQEIELLENTKDNNELANMKVTAQLEQKQKQEEIHFRTVIRSQIKKIPKIEESIRRFQSQIATEEIEFKKTIEKIKKEVLSIEREIAQTGNLDELEEKISLYSDKSIHKRRKEAEETKEKLVEAKLKQQQCLRLKLKLTSLDQELSLITNAIDIFRFWEIGFLVIRRWIIDSQVPIMEETINSSLTRLGMNFSLSMKTMKKKKKGDEEYPDFNLEIVDSYGHSKPIETLSGGEERRVAVAVAVALIEQAFKSTYMSFNILLVDEVVDSLDDSGVEEFSNILSQLDQKKIVISHNNRFKEMFEKVITVHNKDGRSWIGDN